MTSRTRKSHRRRTSALSSDTTSTLPEYISTAWHNSHHDFPSDRPPEYPDSAEEADEDTDTDNVVYLPRPDPSLSLTSSPRRTKRPPAHKRRHSAQVQPFDPYLDSLLERSVHALEMSNTLLQSSISTQTSLSTILALDSPADLTLEARAHILTSRIRGNGNETREAWADDLEEITKRVEGLFGDSDRRRLSGHSLEGSVSSSLPASSSIHYHHRNRRRPSLDLSHPASSSSPTSTSTGLQLSHQDRTVLVSPPPRAITQYIASTEDPESFTLPSTLGLRSPPSAFPASDWRPLTEISSASTANLHALPASPRVTDRPIEPSTPAYNMLSSFVYRTPSSGPSTPSSSFVQSFMKSRRGSSAGSASTERSRTSPCRNAQKSPDLTRSSRPASRNSRSTTPKNISPHNHRQMTPPLEESSSSSSSSSSSDGPIAKLTVVSLRKILDDQPPPVVEPPTPGTSPAASIRRHLRPPAFLPRSPAPVAEAGTSTATASVSRLFTKGIHSSSTRPPSPPRHSAMKQPSPTSPSGSTFPTPSPSRLSVTDFFGVGVAKALGSTSSSGRSTPKRISFAELPESYASTKPEGAASKFKDKRIRKEARRGRGRKRGGDGGDSGSGGEGIGWWSGWFGGGGSTHGLGVSLARHEERMQDRLTRNWGGKPGGGYGSGFEEWAV